MSNPMLPPGTGRYQCTVCGLYFTSAYPFGKHRVGSFGTLRQPGTRRCLTVDEMRAAGFEQIESGHWSSGAKPASLTKRHPRQPAISPDPGVSSGVAS